MPSYQTFTVPRSVTLSAEHMERVEACLDEFARNTGALNILLTDPTGQLITLRGRIDKRKAEALAALIAGSHAASAEFIKLLGKEAPFVNLSHEADDYSIYSTNVADELILSVAFGEEVKIGIVRVFIEQARRSLSEIVHEAILATSDGNKGTIRLVDEDFDHFLDKEFEKLTDHKK
jgi:predicted regulator of Ras-like GTPase activity (Roadblock/LC7/MglB family)